MELYPFFSSGFSFLVLFSSVHIVRVIDDVNKTSDLTTVGYVVSPFYLWKYSSYSISFNFFKNFFEYLLSVIKFISFLIDLDSYVDIYALF